MCKCSLIDPKALALLDPDNGPKLVVCGVDDLLELACDYLDQNTWIRPRLRYSLQKKKRKLESPPDTPPDTDTLPNTPPNTPPNTSQIEDSPWATPAPENTPSAADRPPNSPPNGNTPPADDTPPNLPPNGNTPSADDTLPIANPAAHILRHDFPDYNTTTLIELNIDTWFRDPSSFYNQGIGKANLQTKDAECRLVQLILNLGLSDAHSHALRRICSIVLYRIRNSFPHTRGPKEIARLMYGNDYDASCIKTITRIMGAGSIYNAIGEQKGYGILLLLGAEIPLYIWEGKLRHSGPYFEQIMKHLDKQGVTAMGKLYDTLVLKIIGSLETDIPKPSVKFIDGPKKRACPSTSTASKPKSKRTRLSTGPASKPKRPRTTASSISNPHSHHTIRDPSSRVAPLGAERMAMRNLVSDYPPPNGSSTNSTGLSSMGSEVDGRDDEPAIAAGNDSNQGSNQFGCVEYGQLDASQQLCGTVDAPILFPNNNPNTVNAGNDQLNTGDTYGLNTSAVDYNPHNLATFAFDFNNPQDLATFNPQDLATFAFDFNNPQDLATFASNYNNPQNHNNPQDLATFASNYNTAYNQPQSCPPHQYMTTPVRLASPILD